MPTLLPRPCQSHRLHVITSAPLHVSHCLRAAYLTRFRRSARQRILSHAPPNEIILSGELFAGSITLGGADKPNFFGRRGAQSEPPPVSRPSPPGRSRLAGRRRARTLRRRTIMSNALTMSSGAAAGSAHLRAVFVNQRAIVLRSAWITARPASTLSASSDLTLEATQSRALVMLTRFSVCWKVEGKISESENEWCSAEKFLIGCGNLSAQMAKSSDFRSKAR